MEERHKHYNEERPHRAIGQKPPMMLLNRVGASSPL
jgi:putative transposase